MAEVPFKTGSGKSLQNRLFTCINVNVNYGFAEFVLKEHA